MNRTKITLSLIALLLLLLCAASFFGSGPPSDRTLEESFRLHEAEFNRLVRMFKEDSQLQSVTPEAAYLPSPGLDSPKAELPPQRMSLYRNLLQRNGLRNIHRDEKGNIFLNVYFVDLEESKDYVYAESPPSPLIGSLDDTNEKELLEKPQSYSFTTSGYKRITGNWYLGLHIVTG